MRIAITGGGTGGHIYPAVAVLKELKKRTSGSIDALWIGTANRKEAEIVPKLGIPLATVEILPLKRSISFAALEHNAALAWNLVTGRSVSQATSHLKEFAADCLISTGGYVAYPACHSASKLSIPLFIIEPNSTPGLTTLKTAKMASIAFCASELVSARLSRLTSAETTGVPVRTYDGALSAQDIKAKYGLDGGKTTILVTGGSLGAEFINKVTFSTLIEMIDADPLMASTVQIIHQTGGKGIEIAEKLVSQLKFSYVPLGYIEDTPEVLSITDVLLGRSGASTVAEAAHFGIPAIFFPYAHHKDNQQILNALPMVEAGAAFMHLEEGFEASEFRENVKDAITGSKNPEFRKRIKEFDQRAAEVIADRIADFLEGAAN